VLLPLVVDAGVDAQLQVVLPHTASLATCHADGSPAPTPAALAPSVVHSPSTSQLLLAPSSQGGHVYPGAEVVAVPTPVGAMIAFEGAVVFHRVTPLGASSALSAAAGVSAPRLTRVVLSMTFTTDTRAAPLAALTRRLKDMTYFGPLTVLQQ
jgi:hypothetical protein